MIACVRKLNSQKFNPRTIKCRNYANYEPNNLNDDVSKIDWQPAYQTADVSAALEFFNRSLKSVFDHHAPVIEKRIRSRKELLSRDIKKSMNDRDKLLRIARRTKNQADWTFYKQMRNFCNKKYIPYEDS